MDIEVIDAKLKELDAELTILIVEMESLIGKTGVRNWIKRKATRNRIRYIGGEIAAWRARKVVYYQRKYGLKK